jgi:FkbM family methyltransferase
MNSMAIPSIKDIVDVPLPPIHIVDIGAMQEGEDRYDSLVKNGLARVTGFEPNPGQYQVLSQRQGPRRYLPYCLGDGKPATMHATRYPGCSSLYEPDPAVIDLFTGMGAGEGRNFQVMQTVPLDTVRLDDVPDLGPVDYLKLDIQGAEVDVLRHGTQVLRSVLVLESEVEFLPLYKGQPLFADVQSFLLTQGFHIHKLIDMGGRCIRPYMLNNNFAAPISQLLFADAVFLRDLTRLDRFTNDELLKTAAILHEVYRSYDMVIHFLREHDRRTGTALVDRYFQRAMAQGTLPTLFANIKLRG